MPNWCYTDINILGDRNEVIYLHNKLLEATSENYVENGFGTKWLGNIVESLGISYGEVSCRGQILDMGLCEDHIWITMESAWNAHLQPFLLAMERYAPNTQLLFRAEEDGCGEYYTNDPDYVDKYVYEVYDDWANIPDEVNWEYTILCEDELRDVLLIILGDKSYKNKTTQELINLCYENEYPVAIHQYEYCNENYEVS